ncbi:kinetochore complex Sim4 subunit Fta1-domain-containing protein [Pseudoneurospora amorphoporcata]|uniref:Kinetochore complex Sim4 subunit Fta1-domain-containing protein n=1 Tax=Pseudoneurospora amorphoporcata TaxID=241081 RepID=A0AAN6SDS3_9PEZI|nr:kinetochore complex Sim4 subunit Fta1-domain-containing protein [Pseudoneurospora amorphoporcata]
MPPRKRQRIESEPEPEPRQSSISPEVLEQRPPFYNTTFSTHRVSPLYVGKQALNRDRLQTLSQRLREILVGDVVRGVEVGLGRADGEDGAMGRAGALELVDIRWVSMGTVLDMTGFEQHESEDEEDQDTARTDLDGEVQDKKALHLVLRYETAQLISDFLSTTFDCRVTSLRLGTRSLVQSWESWIHTAGIPESAKDVVLNLGFYMAPPENKGDTPGATSAAGDQEPLAIKGIDIIIPASEVSGFVQAGKQIAAADGEREKDKDDKSKGKKQTWEIDVKKRQKLAGRLGEEGWEWRRASSVHDGDNETEEEEQAQLQAPFTEALGRYVDKHLGLNLFHPGVRVTKIACGGFVMSEGRLKVFKPREGGQRQKQRAAAVWKLVERLVGKAEGAKALA